VSLWILNQSLLIINELALYDVKSIMANFSGPYSLSMAQFSVRGACGFVLADNPPGTRKIDSQLLRYAERQYDFDVSVKAGRQLGRIHLLAKMFGQGPDAVC
jgi:hypothetical protein